MLYLLTMPAKNEAKSIKNVITSFRHEMERMKLNCLINVIDDHSTDDTPKIARDLGANVYHLQNSTGLASAFRFEREKALESKADCIIHADADGQHHAQDLYLMLDVITLGSDLVIGNRLNSRPEGMSQNRYEVNLMLSRIVSMVSGISVLDSQSGYRIMTARALQVSNIIGDFTYTQEQILRVAKAGMKISEVPITAGKRENGKSKLASNGFFYLSKVFSDLDKVVSEIAPDLKEQ